MFLTSVLSVFALGAGVKVYRENKRKREMPWTVYAEKIERVITSAAPCYSPSISSAESCFLKQRIIREAV